MRIAIVERGKPLLYKGKADVDIYWYDELSDEEFRLEIEDLEEFYDLVITNGGII